MAGQRRAERRRKGRAAGHRRGREGDREPVLRPAGIRYRRTAGHHEGGSAPDERTRHSLGHPGLCRRYRRRGRRGQTKGRGHLHGLPREQHGLCPRRGGGLRRQWHPCAYFRVPAPHAGAELRRAVLRLPGGYQRDRQPQPQGIQRLQGLLGRRRAAAAPARRRHRRPSGADRHLHRREAHGL